MTIIRELAAGVVLVGVAVGLAATASAEPLNGAYTATLTGPNGGTGETQVWAFTPCGQDCAHLKVDGMPQADKDFHLQGNSWSWSDNGCTDAFDKNSLAGTFGCGSIVFNLQLAKAG
jgi:hypothetical protein